MCVCTVSIDSAGNLAGKRLSSTEKPVLSGTKQKKMLWLLDIAQTQQRLWVELLLKKLLGR